jgi:hypothetical protein
VAGTAGDAVSGRAETAPEAVETTPAAFSVAASTDRIPAADWASVIAPPRPEFDVRLVPAGVSGREVATAPATAAVAAGEADSARAWKPLDPAARAGAPSTAAADGADDACPATGLDADVVAAPWFATGEADSVDAAGAAPRTRSESVRVVPVAAAATAAGVADVAATGAAAGDAGRPAAVFSATDAPAAAGAGAAAAVRPAGPATGPVD